MSLQMHIWTNVSHTLGCGQMLGFWPCGLLTRWPHLSFSRTVVEPKAGGSGWLASYGPPDDLSTGHFRFFKTPRDVTFPFLTVENRTFRSRHKTASDHHLGPCFIQIRSTRITSTVWKDAGFQSSIRDSSFDSYCWSIAIVTTDSSIGCHNFEANQPVLLPVRCSHRTRTNQS